MGLALDLCKKKLFFPQYLQINFDTILKFCICIDINIRSRLRQLHFIFC